jgi:hypothetical protein
VYLAGGSASNGGGFFRLTDVNANVTFEVDQAGNTYVKGVLQGVPAGAPVNAVAYNVNGYGPVIDAAGNWKGKPIGGGSGSQSPWTGDINANGFRLLNAGDIQFLRAFASGTEVVNENGAFVGAGVNVQGQGIGCGYLSTLNPGGTGQIDCGLVHSNSNIVCGSTQPSQLAGTGWIVGDHLGATVDLGAQQIQVGGHMAINNACQFVGQGVNVGGQGIGCGYLSTLGGAPGNGKIDCAALGAQSWITALQYQVNSFPTPVIDQYGAFRGAGVDVTGRFGIGCGYLQVTTASGGSGHIDCASVNCSGQMNCGAFNVTGNFSAAQYLLSNGTVVINTNGTFVGAGVDVLYGDVWCGYLHVRGAPGAGQIDCANLTAGSQVNCNTLNAVSYVVCNGWAVSDPSHNVYFGQLFANYWSGSQPVIRSDGWYTGAGVDVGTQPVYCGTLNTRGGPINCGPINCGPITGGNSNLGSLSCYNCSTSAGYYAHGAAAAYFFDDRTNANVSWAFYSQSGPAYLWFSQIGNVFAFSTSQLTAPSYWIGNVPITTGTQVINSAGQFVGNGVAVGANGVGCGGVNVLGGGQNGTPNQQWTGKTYHLHFQTFVNGAWTTVYIVPYPGAAAYDGLYVIGGVVSGLSGFDASLLDTDAAPMDWPPEDTVPTAYSGTLTLKDGTTLEVRDGRILAPAARQSKGVVNGKVVPVGSKRDRSTSTARSGADKRPGYGRGTIARYGTGPEKSGDRFRTAARFYPAGAHAAGRGSLRQRALAKRSPVGDCAGLKPNH